MSETQNTPEASNNSSEVTPSNTPSTEQAPATTQSTQENIPENWEYNGDRNSVPKQFQNHVKGIDRYWTKKSQAFAEYEKKAKEYDSLVNSDAYKSFQQNIANKPNNTSSNTRTDEVEVFATQDEMDAIALGDSKTFQSVIDRALQKRLESGLLPKEAEIEQKVNSLAMKQQRLEAAELISEFTKIHPDFQDLLDSPVGEHMVTAAKNGMNIEQIYQSAKAIESHFASRAEERRKADLEAKKNGSVVGKSVTGTSDVVYADNEDAAKRLAIEMTLKGDKRQVAVRGKGK